MSGADRRHLALIGLMGAGKTTVGRRCAEELRRPFVDTDELVAGTAGSTVAEIFDRDGEATFRALERDAVADVTASPTPLVIACGGGAVLDADNRRRLHDRAVVVWLQASPTALGARVDTAAIGSRPLLRGDASAVATLERLRSLRAPAYEAAADAAVDTEGLSIEEVVARVLEEWHACRG